MYAGKKVCLRALRREDAPFFVRWMNSYETQRNLGGQLLGSCNVHGIRWGNRCCQVGWVICDPAQRGKGYGREHEFIGGRWHDDYQYGMLDREYFERYGLPEAP